MNNKIEAKYYDGKSSATQQTIVEFNESMKEFYFQTSDGVSFVWKLEDIHFEQYGSLLEVRNKNYSSAILKIDDAEFSQKFLEALKQSKRVDIHTRLLGLGLSKITLIAGFLFGLIVLAYFYALPPIAEKSAALIPESFDNEIGNAFAGTFINENDVDITKTKYLEQFASELNFQNNKNLRFTVVKSKEVNAFALPNGQIVIYTGILNKMKKHDELVALMGHEASHVSKRHSTKMLCRNLAGYMIVSLLFSDVNGVMAVLADNAQQLHSLSYSRKFEEEADEQGLNILMDNKVDPNGMVQLFEQLESEDKFSIPQILSSHPLTKERKEKMQKIISQTVHEVKPNHTLISLFEHIKN